MIINKDDKSKTIIGVTIYLLVLLTVMIRKFDNVKKYNAHFAVHLSNSTGRGRSISLLSLPTYVVIM